MPDNPGYHFRISKAEGQIVDKGYEGLANVAKVPCILNQCS